MDVYTVHLVFSKVFQQVACGAKMNWTLFCLHKIKFESNKPSLISTKLHTKKTWENNLLRIRLQIMHWDKMRGDTRKAKWPLGRMSVSHKQSLWVAVGNIHGKWQALDVSLSILWNSIEQTLGQPPTHVTVLEPVPIKRKMQDGSFADEWFDSSDRYLYTALFSPNSPKKSFHLGLSLSEPVCVIQV